MSSKSFPIIVVAGPTASGKTNLAVKIAQHFSGEIISADSRQIYQGMDIGTGKDLFEYNTNDGNIPYHLIDICDPSEIYTLYHFQQDCYKAITSIAQRGKIPVLAGGTGLYIEAVLKNYKIPNVPENIEFRDKMMNKSKENLIDLLKKSNIDLYNTTDLKSKKRIVRSLEIIEHEKNHTVEWGIKNPPKLDPFILCTRWEREELVKRIDKRLKERIDEGMIEEVQSLINKGVSYDRLSLFGMEYRQLADHLIKSKPLSETINDLAIEIHRLAKRQMTYFRGFERRGLPVHWIDNADYKVAEAIINEWIK